MPTANYHPNVGLTEHKLQARTLSLCHMSIICLLPYQTFRTNIIQTLAVITYTDPSPFPTSMLCQMVPFLPFTVNKNRIKVKIPKKCVKYPSKNQLSTEGLGMEFLSVTAYFQ